MTPKWQEEELMDGIQSAETKPENEDVFHSILYTIFPNLKYLSTFFRYRTLGVRGRGNSQSI